jgi:ABC-type transporter Mla subunit MlaD
MKDNKANAFIAIVSVLAAIVMAASLSFAIGKWNLGNSGYKIVILFPNATGINPNSAVKFAGANVGTVREVRLIPRKDQTIDPGTDIANCIQVVAEIDHSIEIGNDVTATIKQDGIGIAAKYILLTPGPDRNSPDLVEGSQVQGQMPFDLSELVQPAGQALTKANALISQLQPVIVRLDSLSQKMDTALPPLMDHADKFLQSGDAALSSFNTPEGKERLNAMLDSLRVSSENLKVVSTNAKALTATLAEKPWRVFWGGPTVQPPSEDAVLNSNHVIKLKPQVEVNAPTDSASKKKEPVQP